MIADFHMSDLRNFLNAEISPDKAEAFAAENGSRLQITIITQAGAGH